MSKRKKPFLRRSRQYKKNAYISVKNAIRKQPTEYGGLFGCTSVFIEDQQWQDFYFLGLNKPMIYNASIMTIKAAYDEAVNQRASEDLQRACPSYDPLQEMSFEASPHGEHFVEVKLLTPTYKELNGMTSSDWRKQRVRQIVQAGEVEIRESVKKDFSYNTGIGLDITIDSTSITPEIIKNFISNFRSRGEREYQGNKKYSFPIGEYEPHSSMQPIPLA